MMWKPNLQKSNLFSSKKNEGYSGIFEQFISPTYGQVSRSSNIAKHLSFRNSLLLAAIVLILYMGIWFLIRDDPSSLTVFGDIGAIVVNSMATLCLLYAARLSRRIGRKLYISWMILAIAQFSYVLGDVIWAYYELALNESPFPSLADGPYVLRYLLFLIGMLILPAVPISSRERLKLMLDTGIVMIASILLFWTLIIAPTIEQSVDADELTLILSVAYPVMDLMLLFALVDLLLRRLGFPGQRALLLLAAGTFFLIVTDSVFNRQSLDGTYISGEMLDNGWIMTYIMIGLAGLSQAEFLQRYKDQADWEFVGRYGQIKWPLYLPYIAAGGAFALLVWSHDNPLAVSFTSLAMSVGVIIGLVVTRQIIVLNENANLYVEAQEEIAERLQAEMEVKNLNEELERRVAERTSQLEATNKDLQSQILERQMAEDALKDSERRLGDIINFLPDATFVINRDGVVIAWNLAIEKMTGIKAANILKKGNYEYALPFYKERRPLLIDLVLKPDLVFEKKYESIKWQENGTLVGDSLVPEMRGEPAYLLGSAAVLYDSEGMIYGAIESIRDITDRKMAEEDLKSAKDRAESATKAKSKFLANMSHEIRTPMNAVIGMSDLLLQTDLKPEQRDYLETISSSGNALLAVINDILDYSKIDGDKLELEIQSFELAGCIEVSMDLVAAKAADKGLEMTYFLEDNVPAILIGDEIRLRQILINLLGNAV
jgi:PAS domain S-box-containing protein